MMMDSFEYRLQARRPANYLALGLGVFTACAVLLVQAALWAWVPVGLYLAILLWQLLRNPSDGLSLRAGSIDIYSDNRLIRRIPLAWVRSAQVRSGVFAPDACILKMHDGNRITLPAAALPPARRLKRELQARGVSLA